MNIPSNLLEEAVQQMSSLPSIGKRTALRLVLHLLKRSPEEVKRFTFAFENLIDKVNFCSVCHNIADNSKCNICSNPNRNQALICVVEDVRDVMAIESTQQFNGLYHVLGGVISPMEGIGPKDLNIDSLLERAKSDSCSEVILALKTTMEGDTTNFFLFKKLSQIEVEVSILSRGVAVGDELAYADEVTLGRSILGRLPFENTLS